MQTPGIASVSNFASNLKGRFAFGYTGNPGHLKPTSGGFRGTPFNFSTDKETGKTSWDPQLSVGGVLSSGYGAVGGAALGAGIGVMASQFTPGGNALTGAAVGAGVGAAGLALAPVAIGAAARGGVELMGKVPDMFGAVGSGVIHGLDTLGRAAGSAINYAASALSTSPAELRALGLGGKTIAKSAIDPIGRHIRSASNLMGKLVKHVPNGNPGTLLPDHKFTGLGIAALGAGSLIKGTKDAFSIAMTDKMGQRDNYITQVSPQIRLTDNAGATGDLVFALNNNRRG